MEMSLSISNADFAVPCRIGFVGVPLISVNHVIMMLTIWRIEQWSYIRNVDHWQPAPYKLTTHKMAMNTH
jgi:hypothetical protein